ncbi:uncharacterized protein LOC132202895 [Neocloeon triangulifer]|uniref:uncharacterized protein LOC132202895 n=1 Tax=Neocloeon triangulifer TaxID=2078957 RepID=UPI00286F5213|nr:uncharacterized protein LOC132202895 [Neocloeon triangulifer]
MRVSTSNQGLCQRLTWSTSSIFKAFIVSPWCLQLIKGDVPLALLWFFSKPCKPTEQQHHLQSVPHFQPTLNNPRTSSKAAGLIFLLHSSCASLTFHQVPTK